jgi:hypothetical protein
LHFPALTPSQRNIVTKVRELVDNSRNDPSIRQLQIVNDFSAGDRDFVHKLVEELHLTHWWDEFDAQDRNVVTIALPEVDEEDEEADEESRDALDRTFKKYANARVLSSEGFDEREDERLKVAVQKWKNDYYKVRCRFEKCTDLAYSRFRRNLNSRTSTRTLRSLCTDTSKDYNGSCTIIIVELYPGAGSTTIIMHRGRPVGTTNHLSDL